MKANTLGWIGGVSVGLLIGNFFNFDLFEMFGSAFAVGWFFGTIFDLIIGVPELY